MSYCIILHLQVLQGDLAEHEVGVEKLQKAANSLMSLDDDLVPNQDQIQLTTGTISVLAVYTKMWFCNCNK